MRVRVFILSVVCLLLLAVPIKAQYNPGLMRYAGNIMQFDSIWPQEKVFLHFDNTGYFEGETIWFKAYVVNASNLQRSSSGVLYVDLLSPTGILLQQKKLKIVAGQADGCFVLYDASTQQARAKRGILPYPSGYYEIRAYTQYMLNFDDNIVFSRIFPIFQKPKDEGRYDESKFITIPSEVGNDRPKPEKLDDVNVSFYPEGGHIVAGLPVNVAFKATDNRGYNIDGILRIDDNIAEGSVEAATEHDGMGSVHITPTSTQGIIAKFTHQGTEYRVKLPSVEKQGYTITVNDNDKSDSLVLSVDRSAKMEEYVMGLTVTCRGKLIHHSQFIMSDSITHYDHTINTDGWPLGVCHLVLYSGAGNMLSSRNLFHYNMSFTPPSITVDTLRTDFSPFSKVQMSLKLQDRNGVPFRDRIALSVRDSKEYGTIYSDNLMTNLLLSSDLKGFIYHPEYYFESDDSVHRRHTDLLMLVQGWERYNWKYMSGTEQFNETKRLEKTLGINGWVLKNTISSIDRDVFLPDVDVYSAIALTDRNIPIEYGKYRTDSTGYFGFDTKDFYGVADLTINLVYKRPQNVIKREKDNSNKAKIRLERVYTPELRPIFGVETLLGKSSSSISVIDGKEQDSIPSYIKKDKSILLPTVDINAKRKYLDYNTFQAFNVRKDVEKMLDMGEYPTDILGYLLDKGYHVSSILDQERNTTDQSLGVSARKQFCLPYGINGYPVFAYVHTEEKMIENNVDFYLENISHLVSINISENTLPMYAIADEIPLFYKSKSYLFEPALIYSMRSDNGRFYLMDILVKDDYFIPSAKQERDLSKRVTTLAGYFPPEEFYAPEYPDGPIPGDVDYRRTLYWNPNLVTDSVGRAQVEFYNNSYSTGFSISGTGMTASGTPYIIDETYTKPED